MRYTILLVALTVLVFFTACEQPANTNTNANRANTNAANANTSTTQNLTEVPRPQKISETMAGRGEQDQASPTLTFVEPKDGATVNNSTVKVKLNIGGDLKGYKPM